MALVGMRPFEGKVQAPLCKFLYEGRVEDLGGESKSALISALRDGVKLELPKLTSDHSVSSDCEIDELRSTPVKGPVKEVVVGSEVVEARAKRKCYDHRRHFQDSWAAKLPWAESVVGELGIITEVRCRICTDVEGREKFLVPKLDSLYKHAGRRKALVDIWKVRRGEHYNLGTNQQVKNERVFFAKGGQTVITKVLAGISKERRRKLVQFRCCLEILQQGRPIADYSAMQDLPTHLNVSFLFSIYCC